MSVALRSKTILGYASHTNPAVTKPTGTASGDVLLLLGVTYNGSGTATTPTPPAGFNAFPGSTGGLIISDTNFDGTGDNMRLYGWTKVAGGSEGTSYTVTQAVGNSAYYLGAYTGADNTTPMGTFTGDSGTGTTSTALAVTPTVNGSEVIVLGGDNGDHSNNLTISGTTPTFTLETTTPVVLTVFDGTLATAASTGNKTFTNNNASGTEGWVTGMLVINAVAAITTIPDLIMAPPHR